MASTQANSLLAGSTYVLICFVYNKIKILMQAPLRPPTHFSGEQEYNFRVKVNYNNGAITVHGPQSHLPTPTASFPHPPIPLSHTQPHPPQPVPLFRAPVPYSPGLLPYSPSCFSLSTSPSQEPAGQKMRGSSDMQVSGVGSISSAPTQFNRNSRPLPSEDKEQEVDCVICEKKFRASDFEYHLELHRNSRRKTEEVSPSFHKNNELNPQMSASRSEKGQQNSLPCEVRPQLLYSFHNQKSQQNSIQHSLESSRREEKVGMESIHQSSRISQSHNSSLRQSEPVNNSRAGQVQSGIRYLNSGPMAAQKSVQILNNSLMSRNSREGMQIMTPMPSPIYVNRSIQYSQGSNSSGSSQQLPPHSNPELTPSHNSSRMRPPMPIAMPTGQPVQQARESINPFELIEQEQSKVYEYFPEFGHYSLSQHRANPQPVTARNVSYQQPTTPPIRDSRFNFIRQARDHEGEDEVRSRMSASSISSIRSHTEPLEDMSRGKILRTYHNHRNPIDLSNIIGMSEVLAREGVPPSQARSTQKQPQASVQSNPKTNRSSNNFKVITANSMILTPHQAMGSPQEYARQPLPLEMMAVQGRQIYRGTQVEEDDFRGFESVMNATRSSKSSAKTKLPRNYLAVHDFINGSQTLRRPD